MPYTLAQLEALDAAILQGASSVSYEGKSVTYRSLDDMLRIRNIVATALGVAVWRPRTFLVAHSRGSSSTGTGGVEGSED